MENQHIEKLLEDIKESKLSRSEILKLLDTKIYNKPIQTKDSNKLTADKPSLDISKVLIFIGTIIIYFAIGYFFYDYLASASAYIKVAYTLFFTVIPLIISRAISISYPNNPVAKKLDMVWQIIATLTVIAFSYNFVQAVLTFDRLYSIYESLPLLVLVLVSGTFTSLIYWAYRSTESLFSMIGHYVLFYVALYFMINPFALDNQTNLIMVSGIGLIGIQMSVLVKKHLPETLAKRTFNLFVDFGSVILSLMPVMFLAFGWVTTKNNPINVLYHLCFIILTILFYFVSNRIKSSALLIGTGLATAIYLISFVNEYLVERIGYSLSYLLIGLVLIGFGFIIVKLNHRISESTQN